MFEILSKLGFKGQKKPWGCRTELVLKRVFFAVCPLRAQISRAGGARRCRFFPWISGPSQKWPRGCGAEGFSVFFGFFVDPVFANLKWSSSHPPLFLWVFSFLFAFFLGMGVTPHCTCVFGQLAFNPSYYFFVFWGLLTKALFFSLKKGYFGSFLSASLSFSLASFTSLCHTLSLSLSFSLLLLSCFLSFLVVLSLFLPSLFFVVFSCLAFFRFCFMKRTTTNITFESFHS